MKMGYMSGETLSLRSIKNMVTVRVVNKNKRNFLPWSRSGPSLIALDFDFQAKFELEHLDYEKQLMKLVSRKERTGLIISNPSQSLFLFVDKHHVQVQLCYKP